VGKTVETLGSLVKGIMFGTIYGAAIFGGLIYLLFAGLKKVAPNSPSPGTMAAIAGILAIAILPSIPRYEFERHVLSMVEKSPWAKETNRAYWSDITEPLTLLITPVGAITITWPGSPVEGQVFHQITKRYGEADIRSSITPDCNDHTIRRAFPDDHGVLRYSSAKPEPMTAVQKDMFCAYDWRQEREALLAAALRKPSA
jgi:hypothetical protein